MAKSLRSKSKRAFRSKKRESGKYAAAEAARLSRLHARLAAIKDVDCPAPVSPDTAEEIPQEDQPRGSYDSEAFFACLGLLHPRYLTPLNLALFGCGGEEGLTDWTVDCERHATSNIVEDGEGMTPDEPVQLDEKLVPVSTHGPRSSRRGGWRKSKGMDPIPKRRGMNRQGGLAARQKAGRPSRGR